MTTVVTPAHIVGPNSVTIVIGEKTHSIRADHQNFHSIREAIKQRDWTTVETLLNTTAQLKTFSLGKVRIDNGVLYFGEEELHNSMVNRILDMVKEGFDATALVAFLENLMQNPSRSAVEELYQFLEKNSLPITEDGHFLAYKKVNTDYKDFYTGTVDHSIGTTPKMPRNKVDDNRSNTCSQGLHFCSMEYLPKYHGGYGRVVILKINPRDVVSIPTDYNLSKGRACTYEVIGEHESEKYEAFKTAVYTSTATPAKPNRAPPTVPNYNGDGYQHGYEIGKKHAESGMVSQGQNGIVRNKLGHYVNSDYQVDYRKGYAVGYAEGTPKVAAAVAPVWSASTVVTNDTLAFDAGRLAGKADRRAGVTYGTTISAISVQQSATQYWKGYSTGWAE